VCCWLDWSSQAQHGHAAAAAASKLEHRQRIFLVLRHFNRSIQLDRLIFRNFVSGGLNSFMSVCRNTISFLSSGTGLPSRAGWKQNILLCLLTTPVG